jgi:nucleoside-diphosphate-sugar epimerase
VTRRERARDEEDAMRVLVVGASGAIGSRLVPRLRADGHEVIGTSRSAGKTVRLQELGAEPVVLDALDGPAARQLVARVQPDAIVYQATALAGGGFSRKLDTTFALTNQLRTRGTDNLLAAAQAAGVSRFVAQSFAPYRYAHQGGPASAEDDPLVTRPPASAGKTFAAMSHVDDAVTGTGGISLRYGGFYGDPDAMVKAVQKRRYPIVGDGSGLMSFIHLDDAATATVLALGHDGPAIYNITDDEPAATRDWLPALAAAVGARPPRHFPTWVGRLVMGEGLDMMTGARGASNARAKKELDWTLAYPSWRQGFPASFGRAG